MRMMILLAAATLAACSGGGGGGAPAPPSGGGSGWQQGVFLSASTFQNQCQTLDENNFLRSYSDDTYLWYDEITDRDPAGFGDTLAYFDQLRTLADSPTAAPGKCMAGFNGAPRDLSSCKDKFHFTFDTDAWLQLSQSGVSVNYGATWVILASSPPREVVVAYTELNTPATDPAVNLSRGARLISIDNEPVIDGDPDILNAGLFPSSVGETHDFEVQDLNSQTTRPVSITAGAFASDPVQNVSVIDTPTGKVGYMLFNDHIATAEQALIDAINLLNAGQGIDDLVLDIRYNGGGFLAIASELAYMIAGANPTTAQTFELLQFNDKHLVFDPVTGQTILPIPFYNVTQGQPFNGNNGVAGQALPSLDLQRVYVITGPGTCSASEAIMNGLRGVNVDVIQIGSTTCGKPYGFYPTDNCGTTYFTIQFRGINAMNFGDYTDGFQPSTIDDGMANVLGCAVTDDFTKPLGDAAENRLEVALAYRNGQGCIAPAAASPGLLGKPGTSLWATDGIVPKSLWHTNRIYRR